MTLPLREKRNIVDKAWLVLGLDIRRPPNKYKAQHTGKKV
jgi:hypothetical protein